VASIYSVGLSHMNRYVQEFFGKHPKANVRLEYQHPDKVYELVENDQVDLGLVSYPRPSRTIESIAWREEPMVVVVAPQHPLARQKSVALPELDGLRMVGFEPSLRIRREIDRVLDAHEVEPDVAMEFDNIETIKRAIEIDAGIGLLPLPTIDREVETGSLVAVPLAEVRMVRPLGIIVRRGKALGETAASFMRFLKTKADEPLLARRAAANGNGNGDSFNPEPTATEHAKNQSTRTSLETPVAVGSGLSEGGHP
jgi:DNA-binding transcriptional LysR family regulator